MFCWKMLLRKLFLAPQRAYRGKHPLSLRREHPKTRRPRPAVKLILEEIEPRIVPSASSVTSQLVSTLDQRIATVEQDVSSAWKVIGQEIAQEIAYAQAQWDHFLGINANNQTQSPSSPTPQPGSGSGSGSGATPTHPIAPSKGERE